MTDGGYSGRGEHGQPAPGEPLEALDILVSRSASHCFARIDLLKAVRCNGHVFECIGHRNPRWNH
jgi:hypothetical protein